MWDQLTPADIERVKQRLLRQRDEMLRRHTEELSGLDAEQAELETLEQLLLAFTKKHPAFSASESASNSEPAISVAQDREDPLPEPPHNDAAPRAYKCTIKSRPISVYRSANSSAGR
jgi:hypothetical protein